MPLIDALLAIRSLTDLPEPRRRHLCVLAADARTDAERARIVFRARDEERRVRRQTEATVEAELAEKTALAEQAAERPVEGPQKPAGRRRWHDDDVTYPEARPVTVTWGPITKIAPDQVPVQRRRLNEPVRHHGWSPGRFETKEPMVKPEPKPRPLPEHGTVTRYQNPHMCRCSLCRAAKSAANRGERKRRAAQRAERAAMRRSTD